MCSLVKAASLNLYGDLLDLFFLLVASDGLLYFPAVNSFGAHHAVFPCLYFFVTLNAPHSICLCPSDLICK